VRRRSEEEEEDDDDDSRERARARPAMDAGTGHRDGTPLARSVPGDIPSLSAMDESPEELEQIRREADEIDIHQYRKRFRVLKAIGLGAVLAGLTWLVLIMVDSRRNPCQRVRDYLCKADAAGPPCRSYEVVLRESVDEGPTMRANIRAQCQSKIDSLLEDQGIHVK
jgi:hypothetical protein